MFKPTIYALVALGSLVVGTTHAFAVCDTVATEPAAVSGGGVASSGSATQSEQGVRLRAGDTLATVLRNLQVPGQQAKTAFRALSAQIDLTRLQAGQLIRVCLRPNATRGDNDLVSISLEQSNRESIAALRSEDGTFHAKTVLAPAERAVVHAAGVIQSSLFAAAGRAGVPDAVIVEMIRAFAWDVDFQRDIRRDDRFEILFHQYVNEAGDIVDTGDMLYARLILGGKEFPLYRFAARDGSTEYYGPDGKSVRKSLLRTPIDGARISSRYGMRKHPILGYTRMHQGVDFAAPTGTPIYAAGDGKVEFVGSRRGYGKYIRIRHGNEYATAYAHMSRYRKGLRPGKSVKQGQVIGYVGSTGRSTGPHLHYEVLRDGRQVDPARIKNLPGRKLRGTDLTQFNKQIATLQTLLATLPTSVAVSEMQDAS